MIAPACEIASPLHFLQGAFSTSHHAAGAYAAYSDDANGGGVIILSTTSGHDRFHFFVPYAGDVTRHNEDVAVLRHRNPRI